MLKQGIQKGKEDFLQKITNTSDIQGENAIKNMKTLQLIVCDFMVYKGHKINVKCFVANIIKFRTQNFTSSFIYHHVIIHY